MMKVQQRLQTLQRHFYDFRRSPLTTSGWINAAQSSGKLIADNTDAPRDHTPSDGRANKFALRLKPNKVHPEY